jgi:hypothetical protein
MAPKCAFGEGCSRVVIYKPDADPTVLKPSKYCEKRKLLLFVDHQVFSDWEF